MSIGETHRNLAKKERVKPGAILIAPWQVNANQTNRDKGLDECGCAFCPDEPDDGVPL
jgi:hypothetical protein